MKYAVVMTHNFDSYGNGAVLFDDEVVARKYLRWSWETYLKIEIAEESNLIMSECYCDDYCDFAKVTWADGYETDFTLTPTYEAEQEFLDYIKGESEEIKND